MVSTVKKIKVFISSPSDLAKERVIASEVCWQLSIDLGPIHNFVTEPVTWETHSYSTRDSSAQAALNRQLGDDYDIFLGMFGSRFGTPTEQWGSGTEEEFRLALERNSASGRPKVMFFFSEETRPISQLDGEQLGRVQSFRRKLPDLGVLYSTFDSEIKFRTEIYRQLQASVLEVLRDRSSDVGVTSVVVKSSTFDPLSELHRLLEAEPEIHSHTLMLSAGESLGKLTINLNLSTKALANLSKTFVRETKNLSSAHILARPENIAKPLGRVTEAIRVASRSMHENIPAIHHNLRDAQVFSQRAVSILLALSKFSDDDRDVMLSSLAGLRDSLLGSAGSIETALNSLQIPMQLFPVLDMERKIIIALLSDLERVLREGVEHINASIEVVENR